MVHIKWAIALVVTLALAIATTHWATEHYSYERTMGQLAEVGIMRNSILATLVKEIDEGKTEQVKSKLRSMFDMEVKDIQRARKVMETGYFTGSNEEYIQRIDRYLAPPSVAASGAK